VASLAEERAIRVTAFALNYRRPMACIMRSGPMAAAGPCAEGDMRLREANWQAPLASGAPNVSLFQDTAEADVWDGAFGGGHDDLFVYDGAGRLFAWLPSEMTEESPAFNQDLLTPGGYEAVRVALVLASQQPRGRCASLSLKADAASSGCWAAVGVSAVLLVLAAVLCWRRSKGLRLSRRAGLRFDDSM